MYWLLTRSYFKIEWRTGVVLLLGLFPAMYLGAQPFPCDGSFYLVTFNNTGSELQRLWFDETTGKIESQLIPLSEPAAKITCLGLSVRDMYLYGLDFETYELLRIGADGTITRLGVPENLDTETVEYHAGEIRPDGGRMTVVGRDKKTGHDKFFYDINLNAPGYKAGILSITAGVTVSLSDVATDPLTSIRYGFDNLSKKVVEINGGNVSTYSRQNLGITTGALFFDQAGRLYGYGNPSGTNEGFNVLYQFDKVTGKEKRIWEGRTGRSADGCSCPYTFQFIERVLPEEVLPCSEFSIEYHFTNYTGQGRQAHLFEAVLPPEFTIMAIEQISSALHTVLSGPGTNILRLSFLDILIKESLIRIRVRANPEAEGVYNLQASVDSLPAGLGSVWVSDNPATAKPGDPNQVRVLPPESAAIAIDVTYSCARDTAYLSLPFPADRYRWSDGSTGAVLAVTEDGDYWVEASNDCLTLRDTVRVGDRPEILRLDLEGERRISLGEEIMPVYTTNAAGELTYQWTTSTGEELSCSACPHPVLRPAADTEVNLTITDAGGCTAADVLHITVNPVRNIYLPNAFSPDGDGINDRWFAQGRTGVVRYLRVFNRWGALVFQSNDGLVGDDQPGWDGNVKGRRAEPGVYLYTALIKFPDGQQEAYSGEVVLMRGE